MKVPSDLSFILIDKFHTGQASAKEISVLEVWKTTSEANLDNFHDVMAMLDLITQVKHNNEFDQRRAWFDLQSKLSPKVLKFNWQKYAAVAILLLVFTATMWNLSSSGPVEIDSYLAGNQTNFSVLSDKSEVFLEQNSVLNISEFTPKSRSISTKGDFFVNVEHDLAHPFFIETNQLSIQVLGTSFKVEETEMETVVKVRDGKVLITSTDGARYDLQANEILTMRGQDVTIGALRDHDWGLYSRDFSDESVLSAFIELKSKFSNLDFVPSTINPECRITTKIKQSTIIEVLDEIALIFNVDYTIKEGRIVVNSVSCKR